MTKRDEGKIADVIKKVVSIGVGAAFMTEEAVKNILGDIHLPKEILNGLMQNAKNAKDSFNESLREEVRGYLAKVDPTKLMDDLIERYDIEVNATLRFKTKNKAGDTANSKESAKEKV